MSPTAAGGQPGKKGNVQIFFFQAMMWNYFLLVLCAQCFFVVFEAKFPQNFQWNQKWMLNLIIILRILPSIYILLVFFSVNEDITLHWHTVNCHHCFGLTSPLQHLCNMDRNYNMLNRDRSLKLIIKKFIFLMFLLQGINYSTLPEAF